MKLRAFFCIFGIDAHTYNVYLQANMADRHTQYKNQGKDAETQRKGRAEAALTLRKEKREDIMSKRRNIPAPETCVYFLLSRLFTCKNNFSEGDASTSGAGAPAERMNLDEIVLKAQSADANEQMSAITHARKLLSSDRNPPIDELIRSGILPILVGCLQSEK